MRDLQAARGAALSDDSTAGAPEPGPADRTPADTPAADGPPADGAPADGAPADGPPQPRRTRGLLAVIALLVLALDLITKIAVVAELEGQRTIELGQLLIRVSRNSGAAFSFAQGATLVFTTVAVVVVVVILRISARLRSTGWAVSLGLLLGGASGNLVDRLFRSPGPGRGAVVDFIDFQVFPSFNVADSGIVVGGLLAVLLSFRGIEVDGTRASSKGSRAADDA